MTLLGTSTHMHHTGEDFFSLTFSFTFHLRIMLTGALYSDSKNPFHTNPKYSVRSVPPYRVGITLSFGGFIHSTYPWLQNLSLGHVIWATGCRDMINLK